MDGAGAAVGVRETWRKRWTGQGGAGNGGAGAAVQAAPAAKLGSLTVEEPDFAQHLAPTATVTVIYLRATVGASEVISRPYS